MLQEHFLLTALQEANITPTSYSISHSNGTCEIDGNAHDVIFPISLLELCEDMWTARTNDYYFKGTITRNRLWCNTYPNTITSSRGRNPLLKYSTDIAYYKMLGNTKFGLSPTGDCQWSYRFFEAIMCGAIPILGDTDIDNYAYRYKYYRHSDNKVYHAIWAEENLKIFKHTHVLKIQ